MNHQSLQAYMKFTALRYDLTDIAHIAFMFNGGQSPAYEGAEVQFAQKIVKNLPLIHSNRLNHETYTEPCFPAPQLYLLSHTLRTVPW